MASDTWIVLSNRLLLLQEIMVGLAGLPPAEVAQRSAEGVTWIFDGGTLHTLKTDEVSPPPLIARGRGRIDGLGEVYLAYFGGPPEPCYLALSGVELVDPQEFRLVALYFEHLLAALTASGYREELARQARTDWLTGLSNRHSLERLLTQTPSADDAAGVLEARPQIARTQAEHDVFQKKLAEAVRGLLGEAGDAFRIGAFRIALFLPEAAVAAFDWALAEAGYDAVTAWARQTELGSAAVAELFQTAATRLESRLAARTEAAQVRGPLGVRVHSGFEQVRRAVQERLRSLPGTFPLDDEVELVFDTPTGFALEALSSNLKPRRAHTLVVTSSVSQPYLRDLLSEKPQGLIVGSPDDETLASALGRLEREPFYDGPALQDDDLYPREREVWRLVVRGMTNTQIAEALNIREKTVANYVTNLQDKLFLNNRVELVLYYLGKLERR